MNANTPHPWQVPRIQEILSGKKFWGYLDTEALQTRYVLAAHFVLSRTRWGFYLDVLRSSPALARRAGLGFGAAALVVMAVGGACAGLAGIAEASVLEGRLQSGVGANAGYSGFLVAWLARGRLPLLVPLGVLVAGLAASGDNLQLAADLPSATTYVMQGLLFAAALIAAGRRGRAGGLT